MKNVKYAQRGSATVFAVITMVFLGIVIAGLLPMLTQEMKAATSDRDVVQAQYAAEAGAKRAVQQLDQKITTTSSWTSWLGTYRSLDATTNAAYRVTLEPTIDATHPLDTSTTYTVTSTGKAGNATTLLPVIVEYKYTLLPVSNAPNVAQTPYIALSGAQSSNGGDTHTLTISSGVIFTNAGTLGSTGSAWNNTTLPSNVTLQLNLPAVTYPVIPIPWETTMPIPSDQIALKNSWGGTGFVIESPLTLATGTYYIDGSLSQNAKGNITINSGDHVTIYVMGNASFNSTVTGGNLTVYATNIYPNSSAKFTGNMQMFAQQNIAINCAFTGYSLFMTNSGNININSGAELIKSYLVSGNNLTMDSRSVVTGSLVAQHTINLNGGTITFDNTVISNWGH